MKCNAAMKYVIANLKMNMVSLEECDHYLATLKHEWQDISSQNATCIVCPSHMYLDRFSRALPKSISLGAQDIFWDIRGSYTGETSPLSVKNIGASYTIIGHSERRQYAGETNEMIGAKVTVALKNSLSVILCVGETEAERDGDMTGQVIQEQLQKALADVSLFQFRKIVIAYEPRWAIGTGKTPSSHEIMGIRVLIKKLLAEKYGLEEAAKVPILYGGSVKHALMKEVCLDAGMDGVLVGKESLMPLELKKIFEVLA